MSLRNKLLSLIAALLILCLAGIAVFAYFTDVKAVYSSWQTGKLDVEAIGSFNGETVARIATLEDVIPVNITIKNNNNRSLIGYPTLQAEWDLGYCTANDLHFYPGELSDSEILLDVQSGFTSELSKTVNENIITVELPEMTLATGNNDTSVKIVVSNDGFGDALSLSVGGMVKQNANFGFTQDLTSDELTLYDNYNVLNESGDFVEDGIYYHKVNVTLSIGSNSVRFGNSTDIIGNEYTVTSCEVLNDGAERLSGFGIAINKCISNAYYLEASGTLSDNIDLDGIKLKVLYGNGQTIYYDTYVNAEKGENTNTPSINTCVCDTSSQITVSASGNGLDIEYSKDGINWQDSGTFTDLEMDTFYTFYARYKETDNYKPSRSTSKQAVISYYEFNGTVVTGFSQLGIDAGITEIDIPDYATEIRYSAFQNNNTITSIKNLGNNVTTIGNMAFYNCKGLVGRLTIPNNVISIYDNAFSYCTNLTGDLIIPDSVTSIGSNAFRSCGFNGNLTIGNSVTSIGDNAFYYCSSFKGDLTIPNSVTSIGDNAFYYCSALNGNLTISSNVTSMGNAVFRGCKNLTGNIIIPNGITSIGNSLFQDCSRLTGDITIPDRVTSIGNSAFYNCYGFTGNLTIPNSIVVYLVD